mmetsp:Transcript_109544/g.217524  ORF Transcript_109544/g.217524 Transcript_109544/m.217524 type:complete len:306 (-) Transcript_109544:510-1427(-)
MPPQLRHAGQRCWCRVALLQHQTSAGRLPPLSAESAQPEAGGSLSVHAGDCQTPPSTPQRRFAAGGSLPETGVAPQQVGCALLVTRAGYLPPAQVVQQVALAVFGCHPPSGPFPTGVPSAAGYAPALAAGLQKALLQPPQSPTRAEDGQLVPPTKHQPDYVLCLKLQVPSVAPATRKAAAARVVDPRGDHCLRQPPVVVGVPPPMVLLACHRPGPEFCEFAATRYQEPIVRCAETRMLVGNAARCCAFPGDPERPVHVLVAPEMATTVTGWELEATQAPDPSGMVLVARPAGVVLVARPVELQLA